MDRSESELKRHADVAQYRADHPFQEFIRNGCTNRYLKVVIYAIACLTTSCLYFGWQQYSEMLFRNGAYEWLCEPGAVPEEDSVALCTAQDKAVTRLYSFANGTEFASAAIGGILLDVLGPRYTAILGELLFMVAVVLVCNSSQSFKAYIPGLLLSGMCVNIISFPSLTVVESWPSRQALAVSIIVGAQSGASVIAPILVSIWNKNPQYTYRGIWLCYLAAVWLPVTAFYLWALPTRRDYGALVADTVTISNPEPKEEELKRTSSGNSTPSSNNVDIQVVDSPVVKVDPLVVPEMTSQKEVWRAFWRDLMTIDLVVMASYFFLQMLQFAYYPSVVRDAVSLKISDYVGWMTPLQAVFSIVIGFAMDYTGTCYVMFGMCATLIFVSLSTAYGASSLGLSYTVGIVFVFMQSATYNLKYTFVNEMYDPFNFGKLVGFIGICGGIGVYINAPISSGTNYTRVFLAYVFVAVFMALLTAFLFWRQKTGITHKTIEGVAQKHRDINQPKEEDVTPV